MIHIISIEPKLRRHNGAKRMLGFVAVIVLGLLPATLVSAQGADSDLSSDFATRCSVEIDKKVSKGFHLYGGYELRTEGGFSKIDRHVLSAGAELKLNSWLKSGFEYTFINRLGNSGAWSAGHRLSAGLGASRDVGQWKLSVREELQLTHKTGELNPYQEVRNPVMLKSRFKVQYGGFSAVKPYTYIEIRNTFNDPACSATWYEATSSYGGYTFLGYNDVYINRVRAALGIEWKLNKHHALDFYGLFDYRYDKDIDTDKEGTTLKSLVYDRSFRTSLGLRYIFSF